MKKIAVVLLTALMMLLVTIPAFATEYTVYGGYWDVDYASGTVHIRWDKCDASTRYQVIVFRKGLNSSSESVGTQIAKKTVSGSSYSATSLIYDKGTGIYSFSITPTSSPNPLDDMFVCDDPLEADSDLVNKIRYGGGGGYEPSPVGPGSITTGWERVPGTWRYKVNGNYVRNGWYLVNNRWYYFNGNGDMLMGWQFISGRWYYLNPVEGAGGYPQGACWINGVTPDGYTVNANGEWVVNGVVQSR